jgi:pyrroloquinoline quinone biosynthesis protein D
VVDAGCIDGGPASGPDVNVHSPNKRPRLAKRVRLQIDTLSGNPVLLHQEEIIVLNPTGYEILRLCDGTRTLREILQTLEDQYPDAQSILSREVSHYLEAISQRGLIEWV